MKNIINNIEEAMDIVNNLAQFDSVDVQSILCMAVDTVGAIHGENPVEIAKNIYSAVSVVNAEYGAYTL